MCLCVYNIFVYSCVVHLEARASAWAPEARPQIEVVNAQWDIITLTDLERGR